MTSKEAAAPGAEAKRTKSPARTFTGHRSAYGDQLWLVLLTVKEDDGMRWPICFPAEMAMGAISVMAYGPADAAHLFNSLADERVWEHMSRAAPVDVSALDDVFQAKLASNYQVIFNVRQRGNPVGVTSVLFDPDHPAGVEVGGTLLDPRVWGMGVNTEAKLLLLAVIFDQGAEWVQLRTDERNQRSAAAIQKLGATELDSCYENHVRRDGTRRRSRIFRIETPGYPHGHGDVSPTVS